MRGRAFYEQAGWRLDGAKLTRTFADHNVEEVRYRLTLDKSRVAAIA